MSAFRPRQLVLLGLVITLATAGALHCLLVVPVGRGADEADHLDYTLYLAYEKRLPDPRSEDVGQIQHPPLAYAALAAIWRGLARLDRELDEGRFDPDRPLDLFGRRTAVAPGASVADTLGLSDEELEAARSEASPRLLAEYLTRTWARHALRLTSLLLGLGTLLLLIRGLGDAFPSRPGLVLGAAAVVAFLPQFPFQSAMISNDPWIAFLGAWVVARLLRARRLGRLHEIRGLAVTGALLGLAFLVKAHALGVAVFGATLLALDDGAPGSRRLRSVAVLALGPVLLAAWWHLRQWLLLGSPLALSHHAEFRPGLLRLGEAEPLGPLDMLAEAGRSFVAVLGQDYLETQALFYPVILGAFALALLGLAVVRREPSPDAAEPLPARRDRDLLLACGLSLLVLVVVIAAANRSYYHIHGRYLFALLLPGTILLVAGWERLAGRHAERVLGALAIWNLAFAAFAIAVVVTNRYTIPLEKVQRGRIFSYLDCGNTFFDQNDAGGFSRIRKSPLLHRPRDTHRWAPQLTPEPEILYRFAGLDPERRYQIRLRYPDPYGAREGDLPPPSASVLIGDSWLLHHVQSHWSELGELRYPLPHPITADGELAIWWQNHVPTENAVGCSEIWIEEAWVGPAVPPVLEGEDGDRRVRVVLENRDETSAHEVRLFVERGGEILAHHPAPGAPALRVGAADRLDLTFAIAGDQDLASDAETTLRIVDVGESPQASLKLHPFRGPDVEVAGVLGVPDLEVLRDRGPDGERRLLCEIELVRILPGPWTLGLSQPGPRAALAEGGLEIEIEEADGSRISPTGEVLVGPASWGDGLRISRQRFRKLLPGETPLRIRIYRTEAARGTILLDRLLLEAEPEHGIRGLRYELE